MNRKLKAVAVALTAILAMSALAASGANANLTSSSSHTILHGVQQGNIVFTAGEGFGGITCGTVTFSGTAASTEVETMVVQPTVANCKDSFGRTVDIDNNSLTSTLTNEGFSDVSGGATLTTTSGGSVICTTVLKSPQTNNGSVAENLGGTNGIKVSLNVSNVITTTSGGFFNCGIANGEHKNGTVEGTGVVKGENTAGEPVAISVD